MNEDFQFQKQAKERIIKSGGSWFYWIAALSMVNSFVVLLGAFL
ncbi:MAG: hypothetical protein BWY74_04212 [Firmicutes bacterium ADurb.Bin419]|nr:MAG: hypothetical protein BWY74_04212 [Firmicutes bacterium ADurb.Bin419]